jgi:predicted dehydrogenase
MNAASSSSIRIGFVGAGGNTRSRHIPELQAIPGVELISVANRSRASAERVAAQFAIPRVYDRWEELVAADDTDAIVIGTWPYKHAEVTLAALAAGKHVLCEARMAMNLAEARQMLAAAQAHPQLTVQLVPAPMTLGVDATIQRLLREGWLGELLALNVQANGSEFVNPDAPLHWRQDRTKSGLNILTMGIWYESLMRWPGAMRRPAKRWPLRFPTIWTCWQRWRTARRRISSSAALPASRRRRPSGYSAAKARSSFDWLTKPCSVDAGATRN